jgi:hypothetical protein
MNMFVPGTKITVMLDLRNIKSKRVHARFVCIDGPDGVAVVTLFKHALDFKIGGSVGLPRHFDDEARRKSTWEQALHHRMACQMEPKFEIVEIKDGKVVLGTRQGFTLGVGGIAVTSGSATGR